MNRPCPLAASLRPVKLSDIVGQQHLLGADRPIQLMAVSKKLQSFILWGPAGIGKTTIARALATDTNCIFHNLDATSSGVKELRALIISACEVWEEKQQQTIIFLDECLPYNSLVLCRIDGVIRQIPIGLIVESEIECEVLTVDSDNASWQPIISRSIVQEKPLMEISVVDNNKNFILRCSYDHLVFTTNRGYVEANALTVDDDVILQSKYVQEDHNHDKTQNLFKMW